LVALTSTLSYHANEHHVFAECLRTFKPR